MASNSVIGALRVDLGLNSAQFTTGLKEAQSGLDRFGKTAGLGLAAVAAAAAAAATALGLAVKGAIDHADALSKAAQKAGVATESLSRLAYAASYSDVSLEDLTGSLGKLSKTMADAAQNTKGPAASAFAALGISVTDASGKLRGADSVFSDISDRFARLEDGSTKTALAMALFGKSGAQLTPLLNGGAGELKRMADEADRLGITLSTKTGKAAERFNDTLGLVGQILQGVVNKIAEAALPALQQLAQTLASPAFAKAAQAMASAIVGALNLIVNAFTNAINLGKSLLDTMNQIGSAKRMPTARPGTVEYDQQMKGITAFGGANASGSSGNPFAGSSIGGSASSSGIAGPSMDLSVFTQGIQAAVKAIDPFEARFKELSPVLDSLHDPFTQMKTDLTDLQTMFDNGRITAEQYGAAVQRTNLNAVASFADMAAGVAGALSHLFGKNKAFAVANAVLQGLSGVAYALGSSAPPWNFINAAAVGIEAAANVASILSTSETSTTMPSSGSGSGSAAPAAATAAAPRQAVNISLQGASLFSTDMVEQLLNQMADAMSDGAGSRLINVVRA